MIEELEAYMRVDQEYRIQVARGLLKHASLEPDLRRATAEIECEELLRDRLEKLLDWERAKLGQEDVLMETAQAAKRYYDSWGTQGADVSVP